MPPPLSSHDLPVARIPLRCICSHRPNLTPTTLYSLKIPAGQGQLLIPWKESMKDVYVFRKLLQTPLGVELSDDHLSYDFLRTQLRKVGELAGFAFAVGAYCFRRGHAEALDNSFMLLM